MRIKISAKLARSFTGIVPLLERSIDAAMREAADEALVLYRKTTRTWKTTVNFTVRMTKQGYSVGTRSACQPARPPAGYGPRAEWVSGC